jgi:hypothetical protein
MRIRDPGWRQFGSGIRDGKKSHCMILKTFLSIPNVFYISSEKNSSGEWAVVIQT